MKITERRHAPHRRSRQPQLSPARHVTMKVESRTTGIGGGARYFSGAWNVKKQPRNPVASLASAPTRAARHSKLPPLTIILAPHCYHIQANIYLCSDGIVSTFVWTTFCRAIQQEFVGGADRNKALCSFNSFQGGSMKITCTL